MHSRINALPLWVKACFTGQGMRLGAYAHVWPGRSTWLFHTAERIEREHTHTARVADPHLARRLSRGWGDLKDSHAALHGEHFALERA